MKTRLLIAVMFAAFGATAVAGPFDQFKGKMKDGMYEYKMQMDVPGMPAGMAKAPMTFQQCVTAKDVEDGGFSKGKEGKMPEDCEIKNMKMSGNTATYTMECKKNAMKADNKITFLSDGFNMDMKMQMNHGGQVMNMTQKMEGRYKGPCK